MRCAVLACVLIGAGLTPAGSWADSPVTSTPIHEAYLDYAIVNAAAESGAMTPEIAAYLSDAANPIDVKAAVVSALGWDVNGKHNAEAYCRSQFPNGAPDPRDLDGYQAFVIGYLRLMDDYQHPEISLPMLRRARTELPDSLTVALVKALADAQLRFSQVSEWPRFWNLIRRISEDDGFDGDLRVGALRIILNYMRTYARGSG